MRKWIAVAAMMLAPVVAEAQWVELQKRVLSWDADQATIQMRVRNAQPYTPGSVFNIWGLFVTVGDVECDNEDGDCDQVGPQSKDPKFLSRFDTRSFDGFAMGGIISARLVTWGSSDSYGTGSRWGPLSDSDGELSYGLIGCSVPTPTPVVDAPWAGESARYGGRTCLDQGYNGWVILTGVVNFDQPRTTPFTVDDFDVDVVTSTTRTPTFLPPVTPVPEPSTYALLAAGLFAMGIAANSKRGSRHPRD